MLHLIIVYNLSLRCGIYTLFSQTLPNYLYQRNDLTLNLAAVHQIVHHSLDPRIIFSLGSRFSPIEKRQIPSDSSLESLSEDRNVEVFPGMLLRRSPCIAMSFLVRFTFN